MISSNVALLHSNNCCVVDLLEPAICEDLDLHVANIFISNCEIKPTIFVALHPKPFFVIRFRYNGTTGIFTVPEGGSGLYFLYVHLITTTGNFAAFELKRNQEQICVAEGDNGSNGWNHDTTTCGAVVQLNEGE